jgi:hypothetical protein
MRKKTINRNQCKEYEKDLRYAQERERERESMK